MATLAGDEGLGWVEALAIGEGLVLAAGQLHEVQALVGPDTRRLELGDGYVCLPAITDAHLHLVDAALAGHQLDLEPLADLDAAIGVIASLHAERA
ncbi:MAG: hypothetical protein H0V12_10795, partial [Chloroflexi bacterium]|nr:hypothetical protein [Chloroflexota bacterium]